MPATLKSISKSELEELIRKQGPNKIHWDYNDQLDTNSLKDILQSEDGVSNYAQELLNLNAENLYQQRRQTLQNILTELGECTFEDLDPEATEDEKLDHLLELAEEIMFDDANLKQLGKNSGRGYFTVRTCEPTSFQACHGIRYLEEVAEICETLNISPHKLQSLVPENHPLVLPHIPERDGAEYVDPEAWKSVLNETMYGGEIVFLCGMPIADVLENNEAFRKGEITVHAGTRVMMNDYLNGCASMDDTPLLRNITFKKGQASLYFDGADKCGVQSCLNATDVIWKPGHATAEYSPDSEEEPKA